MPVPNQPQVFGPVNGIKHEFSTVDWPLIKSESNWELFMATLRWWARSWWRWMHWWPGPHTVSDDRKSHTCYKKPCTQRKLQMLRVKSRSHVAQNSGDKNKQGFLVEKSHKKGHMAAAVKKGPFFIKYQVELERGGQVYFRTHLKIQGRLEWLTSKGEKNIPGLADTTVLQMMSPKRAIRVQKLSSLPKEDDVRQYVVRRSISTENKKGPNPKTRVPKTQLHITPYVLKHIC